MDCNVLPAARSEKMRVTTSGTASADAPDTHQRPARPVGPGVWPQVPVGWSTLQRNSAPRAGGTYSEQQAVRCPG